MTFKNKHSFISGFLGAALLIASGCALGGCTEIADEPQGIDDAGNGTPLTIRATASGFVSCVQGDTPATPRSSTTAMPLASSPLKSMQRPM